MIFSRDHVLPVFTGECKECAHCIQEGFSSSTREGCFRRDLRLMGNPSDPGNPFGLKPLDARSLAISGLHLIVLPFKKLSFYTDKKEIQSSATALGYVAHITRIGFLKVLRHLAPAIYNNICDVKEDHARSIAVLKQICDIIIEKADHGMAWRILGSAIAIAVRYGTYELIEECILAYPSIIWYDFEGSYLFHLAIKERQEQVYNLLYQMTSHKAFVASHVDAEEQENALHMAAKLAPPHRLNRITGAALQMQRELQWFKEVETLVEPSYKEALNKNGKTPRMVFTDEHKGLLKEGQQWMKDTSSSCTVVAALIVTVTFAAGFTLPGGNNDDDGRPVFLNKGAFMLFIISNAIALFSSSTSLLMFLGILTSRYAEDDFLYVLPKRMTIGLIFLFLSLATTLITFSAALTLVLQDKVAWIAAPLAIITSIPVCLFGSLQFPVLMELVNSTYGPSIFRKQNDRMIH